MADRETTRLLRTLLDRTSAAGDELDLVDRRRFLALTVTGFAGLLAACDSRGPDNAQKLLRYAERKNEGLERWLVQHTRMDAVKSGARDAGAHFPKYFISRVMPVWNEAERGPWTLEVTGLVRQPWRFELSDLLRLPHVTQRVNHYCVEGWTAVASWTGVRVRDLATFVGAPPEARYVDFESFDSDYHESWDIESATHPQTLIAYGMDGAYLGAGHGAPARLHSPIKLGYKSVKYLTRVVFMAERNGGYWSDQGYEWYAGT